MLERSSKLLRLLLVTLLWPIGACGERSRAPARAGMPEATAVSARAASARPSAEAPVVRVPAVAQPTTLARRELVGEVACEAQFFALRGRTFVACEGELLFLDDTGAIQSDAIHAAGLNLGSPRGVFSPRITAMAGRWPEAAWAVTGEPAGNGNSGLLRFFRWRRNRWSPARANVTINGPQFTMVFAWGDGIALLAPFEVPRLIAVGVEPADVPALTKAVLSKEEAEASACRSGSAMIAPQALARLGPSDVMVFSDQLCGSAGSAGENVSDGSVLALERFRAGRKSGELMLLPPPAELPRYWHEPAAAALSPVDVLVAFNGSSGSEKSRQPFLHLLHWDGQAWRAERAPVGEIAQLWAQAGAFWATDEDGALWMRRHAAWSILEWNEAASEAQALWSRGQITQIHAGEAGALWLVRTEDPRAGVVTSRIYRVRIEP